MGMAGAATTTGVSKSAGLSAIVAQCSGPASSAGLPAPAEMGGTGRLLTAGCICVPAGRAAEARRDGPDPQQAMQVKCVPKAMMLPSLVQSTGAGASGAGNGWAAGDDTEHVEMSSAEFAVARAPGAPAAEMQTSMIPPRRSSAQLAQISSVAMN